eukprot:2731240-Rhodomonas_salina.6
MRIASSNSEPSSSPTSTLVPAFPLSVPTRVLEDQSQYQLEDWETDFSTNAGTKSILDVPTTVGACSISVPRYETVRPDLRRKRVGAYGARDPLFIRRCVVRAPTSASKPCSPSYPEVNYSNPEVNYNYPKSQLQLPKVNYSYPKVNYSYPKVNFKNIHTPKSITPKLHVVFIARSHTASGTNASRQARKHGKEMAE